jgi:hypothetical protein
MPDIYEKSTIFTNEPVGSQCHQQGGGNRIRTKGGQNVKAFGTVFQ